MSFLVVLTSTCYEMFQWVVLASEESPLEARFWDKTELNTRGHVSESPGLKHVDVSTTCIQEGS